MDRLQTISRTARLGIIFTLGTVGDGGAHFQVRGLITKKVRGLNEKQIKGMYGPWEEMLYCHSITKKETSNSFVDEIYNI